MNNPLDEFYSKLPEGRCRHCKFARVVVATDQFMFLGCYHDPYKGKWTKEIKNCTEER